VRDDVIMRRSTKVRIREDRDGVHIVMDTEMRTFSYLNRTAGYVLKAFDGVLTLGDIKAKMRELYPAAGDRISGDVDSIVEKFMMEGYTYVLEPMTAIPEPAPRGAAAPQAGEAPAAAPAAGAGVTPPDEAAQTGDQGAQACAPVR
jgi:hypothetical protein